MSCEPGGCVCQKEAFSSLHKGIPYARTDPGSTQSPGYLPLALHSLLVAACCSWSQVRAGSKHFWHLPGTSSGSWEILSLRPCPIQATEGQGIFFRLLYTLLYIPPAHSCCWPEGHRALSQRQGPTSRAWQSSLHCALDIIHLPRCSHTFPIIFLMFLNLISLESSNFINGLHVLPPYHPPRVAWTGYWEWQSALIESHTSPVFSCGSKHHLGNNGCGPLGPGEDLNPRGLLWRTNRVPSHADPARLFWEQRGPSLLESTEALWLKSPS